jgi:hypothetical protein
VRHCGPCPLMLNPVEFVADRDLRSLTIEGPMTMLILKFLPFQGIHSIPRPSMLLLIMYATQFVYPKKLTMDECYTSSIYMEKCSSSFTKPIFQGQLDVTRTGHRRQQDFGRLHS